MKKLIPLLALMFIVGAAYAQTSLTNYTVITYQTQYVTVPVTASITDTNPIIGGPAASWLAFLGSGSNWMAVPYATYSQGDKSFGGGLGLGYLITPNVVTMMRLDYFASKVYMPSLSIQLQAPVKIMQAATIVPFAFAGAASPISGAGSDNGTAVAIVGAGAALRLDFLSKNPTAFVNRLDLVADYELWNGLPSDQQKQWRFGLLYKF